MHPLPPSRSRPAPGARGASRAALALLAALMFGALAAAQPPKEPDKKEPEKKEPEKKEPTKAPEPRWPTEINGKDIKAVMKDMEDPDPTAREFAAKMLPGFGPPAQKEAERASQREQRRRAAESEHRPDHESGA